MPTCLCGNESYRTFMAGTFRRGAAPTDFEVAECSSCGLRRTLPVPDPNQYRDGMAATSNAGEFTGDTTDLWSDLLVDMLDRSQVGRRVLDVGCHSGNFVVAANRRGYATLGIDMDPVAVGAGQALDRPVSNTELSTFADASFDVVMMNHVFEHIENVAPVIAEVERVLASGGHWFVLVPNHRGLVPRLMRDHWFAWLPTEHVWHFTQRHLVQVVESRSSMKAVQARAGGMIEPPSSGRLGKAKKAVQHLSLRLRWGDQVEAVFVKP